MKTNGSNSNGVKSFIFSGVLENPQGATPQQSTTSITKVVPSSGGEEIETTARIKFNALSHMEHRTVQQHKTMVLLFNIYPSTSDIIIFGVRQEPPEYGKVFIVLKPNDAAYLTTLTKKDITDKLKQYMVASVSPVILDPSILYVEISSKIFYNGQSTDQTPAQIRDKVIGSVQSYLDTSDTEKFNGKFRYSKIVGVIDDTDRAINSNLTSVMMRKDFYPQLNSTFYYEVCFQNAFDEDCDGPVLSSTGFRD